ncbi:MAG: hypothetical protein Q9227_004910 [Pyrenula ochraceoflavens]
MEQLRNYPCPVSPICDLEFLNQIITIHVGSGEIFRTFQAHANILCSASEFFDRAIHSGFLESKTHEVNLPDENTWAFDLLLRRLYEGSLPPQMLAVDNDRKCGNCTYYLGILPYYRLLDKLLFPDILKIEALDSFIRAGPLQMNLEFGSGEIANVIENFHDNDPIYRLMMDLGVHGYITSDLSGRDWLAELFIRAPDEAKIDFVESQKWILERARELGGGGGCGDRGEKRLEAAETLGLKGFTSIVNLPRYQIGYLAKGNKVSREGATDKRVKLSVRNGDQ